MFFSVYGWWVFSNIWGVYIVVVLGYVWGSIIGSGIRRQSHYDNVDIYVCPAAHFHGMFMA